MPGPRVAVGGILTECNDFGGQPIDVAAFERFELRYGDEVLEVAGGVMGGMLEVLAEREATSVPLLFASTSPGGPLTDECYETLRQDLLAALEGVTPVDAVLLALHGAAVSETVHDIEGDLLAAARALVGPGVPIVATLDLHAHVTEAMVTNADGLVAWGDLPPPRQLHHGPARGRTAGGRRRRSSATRRWSWPRCRCSREPCMAPPRATARSPT